MDHLNEWIELLLLSIGFIYLLRALPAKISAQEIPGSQEITADSSSFAPLNPFSTAGILRWIVRTIKRKESPNDDADCPSSH